jgi:hypothetical protein
MKLRLISALLALSILLSACQTKGAQPNQPGAQPQSAGKTSTYASVFTPPAEPAAAVVALDETSAAEALIPLEGGAIQATGADGTQYTLTIPGDALLAETKIRLVPAAVSGLPFGGEQTYAAQLQPEGLTFNNYVTLTIVPAQEIPLKEQLFFGYLGEGRDVIFAPPVKDSAEIKIQLLHFSGYGVTKGLLADPESVRERLGGSAERRLESLSAELLGRERQAQLLGSEDSVSSDLYEQLQPLFERYKTEVVDVRAAAAGESCAAGQLALQTVLGFERQKQLLGVEAGGGGLAENAGLMATVAKVCLKEEYTLCAQDHIIHRMVPVWLGFERQYQMLGMTEDSSYAEISALARDLTQKCLTFDLEFESDFHFDPGTGGGYDSSVKSKVPLKFNPDELKISGSSALINTAFTFRVSRCMVTSNRGGSTLPIQSLTYITDNHSPDDTLGYVRDFSLLYFPESTTESFTVACKDSPPYTSPPSGLWFGGYLVLHQDELDTSGSSEGAPPPPPPEPDIAAMMAAAEAGVMMPSFTMMAPTAGGEGGFLLEGWKVTGGEQFATKEWEKSDGGLGISERGTFKLYHRPPK